MRMSMGGMALGVINVESFSPKWFDERDVETLRFVAEHAAVAVQMECKRAVRAPGSRTGLSMRGRLKASCNDSGFTVREFRVR